MVDKTEEEQAVLLAALERTIPGEREAFLEEACAGRNDLLKRVRDLLAEHDSSAGSMDTPPPITVPSCGVKELPTYQIGTYKLLQRIGEGGMGVVYMAQQTVPVTRRVALKIIKPGMDSRQVIARFEAERQALAMMDHPNISKVLDAGTTVAGHPYFVMELVKGSPISDYCDERRKTARERLELFVPVCQAVQHAHVKGVIHRDIKPSNVLVAEYDDQAVPKIIDFGVAKAIGHQLTDKTLFTQYGQVVGTVDYMSPEQAKLNQLDIDTRCDIYSLGVLLYELLTGELPFDRQRLHSAELDEMLRIIREEEPPTPSHRLSSSQSLPAIAANRRIEPTKLGSLVRGELDWIVMKALEKDRSRRYETANGLAADVQRYLDGKPVEAGRPSGLYRFSKFARQYRTALMATVGLVAILVFAVVGLIFHSLRISRAYSQVAQAKDDATQAEREKTVQLAKSMISEARWRRQSGQTGHRIESNRLIADAAALLLRLQPDEGQILELRNEWIAGSALAVDIEKTRTFDRPLLAFDKHHRAYATRDVNGAVLVLRTADNREESRLSLTEDEVSRPWAARFSPDSRFLIVAYGDSTLRLWDLENQKPALVVDPPSSHYAIDFSPDGRLLAYGDRTRNIHLLDLTTSPPRELPFPYPSSEVSGIPRRLRFDPSGNRMAVSYAAVLAPSQFRANGSGVVYRPSQSTAKERPFGAGQAVSPRPAEFPLMFIGIDVFDLKSTANLRRIRRVPCLPGNVFWSPDGRFLAFGDADFRIMVWDVESNREHAVLEGHRWGGISAEFTHGGDYVTSRSWDGTSRFWDPHSGQQLLMSRAGEAHARVPGDNRVHMATAAGGTIWNIIASSALRCLPSTISRKTELYRVSIHPQGRLLAAACGDGVHLLDLVAGKEIGKLPLRSCQTALFHSQDGALLMVTRDSLYALPVRVDEAEHRVQLGTPTTFTPPVGKWGPCASLTREGRFLVAVAGDAVVIHDLEGKTARVLEGAHSDVGTIDVSPDGRWVVTGNWHGAGVKLWDVDEGAVDDDLWASVRNAGAVFSPDGLHVAACSESQYRVWEVGTWKPLYSGARNDSGPGRKIAFSPSGDILAVSASGHLVRLLEAATGKELATLNSPYAFAIAHFAFDSRGDRLAVLDRPLHSWDLGAIREGLAQIGVDWNLPAYPPAPSRETVEPLKIEDSAILEGLGAKGADSQRFAENIKRTAKAADITVDSRDTYRKLAGTYAKKREQERAAGTPSASTHWHLAVCLLAAGDVTGYRETCKAMLRHFAEAQEDPWATEMTAWVVSLHENDEDDTTLALSMAEQLVGERRSATNLRVLGACLYRAGRVEEADRALREALPDAARPTYVQFLLALTTQELEGSAGARAWLGKAEQTSRSGKKAYWATQATRYLLREQAVAAIDD